MRHVVLVGSMAVGFAAAIACSSTPSEDDAVVTDAAADDAPPSAQLPEGGKKDEEGPAGTGSYTGLPCDVQAVIENRCIACHDGVKAPPMLKYSDLTKPAVADPSKSVAQLAVIRMQSTTSPMPPRPAAPAEPDEIAAFDAWVKAGTPMEAKACTDPPPRTPDGGAPSDGGDGGGAGPSIDGGTCTSGTRWTMGNTGSPRMHPGIACNACHQVAGGPNLRIAGTVYPTLHEPDDCNGKGPPPPMQVIVTASDGRQFTMDVNAAGNFFLPNMQPKPPFRARIVEGEKVRMMNGSVTSGDCNSCHTFAGRNGAPGRILAP